MRNIIVKQEHYNNIEIEIDYFKKTEYGYIITVFEHSNKFYDSEIIDIVSSWKDDTYTFILTDSAFEGFHAWYSKLYAAKMRGTNDELADYSNDDLMFEIRRLRNELELLKQEVEMLKLDKLDSNRQSYPYPIYPYPQYPNVVYSSSSSTSWTPNPDKNDGVIF